MTEQATQQNNAPRKRSFVTYAYGQIYRGFLESGKAQKFVVTNIHVREWKKILGWLKRNKYIVDFKLGDTIETACDLGIIGFNENKLMYEKYLNAIKANMEKEKQVA